MEKAAIEYINLCKDEKYSESRMILIRGVILRYVKYAEDISPELIEKYLNEKYRKRVKYTVNLNRKILLEFMEYYQCGRPPKAKPRVAVVPIKSVTLKELAERESYVDENGILRVKYTKVPAPLAWSKALKEVKEYDYKKSRQARREHTGGYEEDNRVIIRPRRRKKNVSNEKGN